MRSGDLCARSYLLHCPRRVKRSALHQCRQLGALRCCFGADRHQRRRPTRTRKRRHIEHFYTSNFDRQTKWRSYLSQAPTPIFEKYTLYKTSRRGRYSIAFFTVRVPSSIARIPCRTLARVARYPCLVWSLAFPHYASGLISSSRSPRTNSTLLHRISTSPRLPAGSPLIYSSVSASCMFMYESTDTRIPLYSIPHFKRATTGFPVSPARNGFGFKIRPDCTHKKHIVRAASKHSACCYAWRVPQCALAAYRAAAERASSLPFCALPALRFDRFPQCTPSTLQSIQ